MTSVNSYVSEKSYSDQAYEYIRQGIITLKYKPGEYIQDSQISDILNMSRTPVRESFLRLEKEGLLRNDGRKGWMVYKLEISDIYEIFDLTIAIEGMLARKACQCKDFSLRNKLKKDLKAMREMFDKKDIPGFISTDEELHKTIHIMANNKRAVSIINNLDDQWHRIWRVYTSLVIERESFMVEHEEFANAILDNKEDIAQSTIQSHILGIRDDLINVIQGIIMPFSTNGF